MNFTAQQRKAIETRDCNILVSAGAGSGKTGVLTERIIDRLRDGENIDELLVLTYTKAAAAEMLKRIRDKIFAHLAASQSQAEKAHWQKQAMLLGDAAITTLHSFCLQVLKSHYNAIDGLNPKFKILDPNMALVHLDEVLAAYLEECYTATDGEEREAFFSLLRLYGNRLGDDGLKAEMLHLREFGCTQGNFYQWLSESSERFEDVQFWHDQALAMAKEEVELLRESLKDTLVAAEKYNGPKGYVKTLQEDIAAFDELLEVDWSWDALGQNNYFGKLAPKQKDDDVDLAAYLKHRRTAVKDYFQKKVQVTFKRDFSQYAREIELVSRDMATLVKITGEFYERYQSYKLKKGFLEFNDLEQYAYEILRHHPAIATEYQRGFREVLIDEYQDVNPLQEKILSLLSNGHNLFVVGDIKQSIYGFRFADHRLFQNRYRAYGETVPNEAGLVIPLNKNFRSQEQVLKVVNYFFYQWFSEKAAGLSYGKGEELEIGDARRQGGSQDSHGAEVQFIYRPDESEMDSLFDDPEKMRYHGRSIAQRIAAMVEGGETVAVDGVERPLTYGDFAILMRTAKDKAYILEEELVLRGIPVVSPNQRHFAQCQEVRLFISLLEVLDNPNQDIPLAAVMRSPFFAFDENEMMWVVLGHKEKCLWLRLQAYGQSAPEEKLSKKVCSFIKKIENWRQLSKIYALTELIQMLINELHYLDFWSGLPGGRERLRNIEVLREKALEFQRGGGDLFHFLRYLKNLIKTGADTVDSKNEAGCCVQIMTIHKSKGLEFPVVFCAGLEGRFNTKEYGDALLLHSELGFGPKYKNVERRLILPTLPRLLIKQKLQRSNMAERLRLLYVAMTRAQQKLIFTVAVNNKEEVPLLLDKVKYCDSPTLPGDMMLQVSSLYPWLCYGLGRKSRWELALPFQDCHIDVTTTAASGPFCEEKKRGKRSTSLSEEAFYRLRHWLDAKEEKALPAKISVTDLLTQDSKFAQGLTLPRPKFLEDNYALTPAERGTVFHRFMERLPFREMANFAEIALLRDALVAEGYFSPLEGEAIDLAAVAGFCQSPYGEDLKTAKSIKQEQVFTMAVPAREILDTDSDDSILVQGAIDMVYCRANGEWVLLDFKTNVVPPSERKNFLAYYGKQLVLYEKALAQLYHIEVTESLFYLTHERRFLRYK